LSTFLLVVVGVGACIGVVTSLLLRPDEPATISAPEVRAPRQPRVAARAPSGRAAGGVLEPVPDEVWAPGSGTDRPDAAVRAAPPPRPARPPRRLEGEPNRPLAWWRRLGAAVELVAIAAVVGVLSAAAIGISVLILFSLLRGSVG
jgi:hypothetical protein